MGVRKVYGILSAQMLLTLVIAAPVSQMVVPMAREHPGILRPALIITSIMSLCLICCLSTDMSKSYPINYVMLFAFTVVESVFVGFVCAQYTPASVLGVFALTAFIFVGLTFYACVSKTDFTGYGPFLFGALLVMIMFGIGTSLVSM